MQSYKKKPLWLWHLLFFWQDTNIAEPWLEQHWESLWHFPCWWVGWEPCFVSVAPFQSQSLPFIPRWSRALLALPEPSSPGGSPVWSSSAPVGHSSCCHLWSFVLPACRTSVWPFKHVSGPLETRLGLKQCLFTKKILGANTGRALLGKRLLDQWWSLGKLWLFALTVVPILWFLLRKT